MRFALLVLVIALFTQLAQAKESCAPEKIGLAENDDVAQKLFYTGTCHYRNEAYEKAASSWEKLANLEAVNPEYKDLKIDVLNNLGFLMFYGYGITENKQKAIEYWQKAISLGQYESEYHLCHAYADDEVSTYDRVKAKKHCEKAYLIYKGMDNKSKGDQEIFDRVKNYRAKLH